MSLPDTRNITCPICGRVSPTTVWLSVNITLDTTLRQQVMSEKIREHICPACGEKLLVNTDLLYHDMNRKFMIFYHASGDGTDASIPEDLVGNGLVSLPNHQLRIVTSWNQLKEKIQIFEAGLDDNIVEFVKMFIGEQAYGHVLFEGDHIYFVEKRDDSVNQDLGFVAYQNEEFLNGYRYPLAEYKRVAAEMGSQFGPNYGAGVWKLVNQANIRKW